ncbi:MAG: hypothetical protein HY050_03840 [Actinobacteria bacterium]|nr:hypothetical protein [Actinomycetota bacterium]
MNKKQVILGASLISLLWNLYYVIGATLNISSLLTRIAEGQYQSIPIPLRFAYGVQSLIVIFEFFFIIALYKHVGAWSKNSYLLARIFLVLALLSTFVNFASRSPLAQWNTISAVVVAFGFFSLAEIRFRPRR